MGNSWTWTDSRQWHRIAFCFPEGWRSAAELAHEKGKWQSWGKVMQGSPRNLAVPLGTGRALDDTLLIPDLQEGRQPLPTASLELWHSQESCEASAALLRWALFAASRIKYWPWEVLVSVKWGDLGPVFSEMVSTSPLVPLSCLSCHYTIFWAQRWEGRHEGTRPLILRGGSCSLAGLQHFCSRTQNSWGN